MYSKQRKDKKRIRKSFRQIYKNREFNTFRRFMECGWTNHQGHFKINQLAVSQTRIE